MPASAAGRQAIEASSEQLKQLQERRWDSTGILVIYIGGQRFGDHLIISAAGVDIEGKKHVLGLAAGATENAAAVKGLLTHLREQGLPTNRKYLFAIDGAKALRAAIARGVWCRSAGAAAPQSQTAQRGRRVAQGPTSANAEADAS